MPFSGKLKSSQQILIAIPFSLALILVSLIGFSSYRNICELTRTEEWRRHTYSVIIDCDEFLTSLTRAESAHRAYVISGAPDFLERFQENIEPAFIHLSKIRHLTSDNPEQQKRINALESVIKKKIEGMKRLDKIRTEKGFAAAQAEFIYGHGDKLMKEITGLYHEMKSEEYTLLKQRDRKMDASVSATVLTIFVGKALSFIIIVGSSFLINRDIARRQSMEDLLRRKQENLETVNKELEAFSYSVSHDLRAPLRHIDGFVQLLTKNMGNLDERSKRYLSVISDSAKQMGMLIDDLLVFSRMGRSELKRTLMNPNETVQEVLKEISPDLQNRKIDWRIQNLPNVRVDPSMMKQVLVNLISNAVKYTGKKESAKIEIGCAPDTENENIFFVRDNGVGFNMDYSGKLFGVFQRLHAADEFEGTGIGLANVKRIILRHGGRVWAEGAVDQGAVFYFSLPK